MSYFASGYTPVETQILAAAYGGDRTVLAGLIANALTAGGWAVDSELGGYINVNITGVPGDGGTLRPDTSESEVYTWKDAINDSNAREVLAGSDAEEAMVNMMHCINDDGVGKGTLYSTATPDAHPTMVAGYEYEPNPDNVDLILNPIANDSTVQITASESATNVTLTSSVTQDMGRRLFSGITPAGQRAVTIITWNSQNHYVKLYAYASHSYFKTINGTPTWIGKNGSDRNTPGGLGGWVEANKGFTFVVKVTPYWFTIHVHQDTSNYGTYFFHIPKVVSGCEPLVVEEATNSSPIEIETIEEHGYLTGEQVSIEHCLGNTAANGDWTMTKVDEDKFTLDGSVGDGDYTGGGLCGGPDRLVRCLLGTSRSGFRTTKGAGGYTSLSVMNQYAISQGVFYTNMVLGEFPASDETRRFLGPRDLIIAPEVKMPHGSTIGADKRWVGHLWDSFCINREHTRDITTTANEKEWKCFGSDTDWSLWVMEEGES